MSNAQESPSVWNERTLDINLNLGEKVRSGKGNYIDKYKRQYKFIYLVG